MVFGHDETVKDVYEMDLQTGKKIRARAKQGWASRLIDDCSYLWGNDKAEGKILYEAIVTTSRDLSNNKFPKSAISKLLHASDIGSKVKAPRLIKERERHYKCEEKVFAERKEMWRHRWRDHKHVPAGAEEVSYTITTSDSLNCPVSNFTKSYVLKRWYDHHICNCHPDIWEDMHSTDTQNEVQV